MIAFFMMLGTILMYPFDSLFCISDKMSEYFKIVYRVYIYIYMPAEFVDYVYGSILRSIDMQNITMISYVFFYYFIGVPLGIYLVLYTDI